AEPRTPAGAHPPRQAGHVPGPHRVLLLHDEPDRSAAPGVGAGGAGRRPTGEPDHRRPRDRALRPARARPDARPAVARSGRRGTKRARPPRARSWRYAQRGPRRGGRTVPRRPLSPDLAPPEVVS